MELGANDVKMHNFEGLVEIKHCVFVKLDIFGQNWV